LKDKFIGAILGFVVGDILGAPFEGMSQEEIRAAHGYIKGPVKADCYTDDTIMMKLVLESILELGRYDFRDVLRRYLENIDKIYGIGMTTYYALSNADLSDPHKGGRTARDLGYGYGNGPLMRAPPIALYHFFNKNDDELVKDVMNETLLTHYTPTAVTAAIMFSKFLICIGEGLSTEDSYLEALELIHLIPKEFIDYEIPKIFEESLNRNIESLEQREVRGHIKNTIRISIMVSYEEDFAGTLLTLVNFGGDADTNCAIAGAVLGIKLGINEIPKEWLEYVSIRDELKEKAEKLYDLAKSRKIS